MNTNTSFIDEVSTPVITYLPKVERKDRMKFIATIACDAVPPIAICIIFSPNPGLKVEFYICVFLMRILSIIIYMLIEKNYYKNTYKIFQRRIISIAYSFLTTCSLFLFLYSLYHKIPLPLNVMMICSFIFILYFSSIMLIKAIKRYYLMFRELGFGKAWAIICVTIKMTIITIVPLIANAKYMMLLSAILSIDLVSAFFSRMYLNKLGLRKD